MKTTSKSIAMIRNYIKIAWMNMKKNKFFTFINIFGLSAGLACCMLISLYIVNEISYDKYQRNADDIYQLGTIFVQQGKETKMPSTPAPMGKTMQMEYAQVVQSARLLPLFADDKTLIQYKSNNQTPASFYETGGCIADSTFFKMFTYDFIEGTQATALDNPKTVVLSEEIAKKIFGNQPALNKVIHISSNTNGENDYLVTGVFRPIRKPSHINCRFFLSLRGGAMDAYIAERGTNFVNNNMFYTYLQLKPGSDKKILQAQFPAFIEKYAGNDLKAMGVGKKMFLTALKDIHLRSGMNNNVTPPGSLTYLYILASIALFTLLIACINFMNLSTARSSKRSAEVGIRKVLGAERSSLISQFLGESVLISLVAFVFALAITMFMLPAFNSVSGKNLSLSIYDDGLTIIIFIAVAIVAGLLAGSYPAFYLSSFKPVKVLKGKLTNSLAVVSLRKGLVVFQFIISVVLIIASIVISKQMSFLRSADLGFTKDQQLIIPLRSETAKKIYPSLKTEIAKLSQVENVGASNYNPGIFNPSDNLYYKDGQTMNDAKRTRANTVDVSYLRTLGVQPLAGRLFSEEYPADTGFRVILNETAIKQIGFKNAQDAVGKNVYFDFQGKNYAFEIIGVLKDFHFEDMHLPITPYGYNLSMGNDFNYLLVHSKPGNIASLLKTIETKWHALNPNEPFEYSFLDEDFQRNYEADSRLSSIVAYFTLIAIIISCLGLFALATFSAEQRIKEIGVRKVLGASVAGIVALLSKDFLKLVIIAIVVATPIAWYVMYRWLQDFAYRVNINWWEFVLAGIIAVVIAIITISYQAIKAALANPVKSLRTE